jgi:hypothetical protein
MPRLTLLHPTMTCLALSRLVPVLSRLAQFRHAFGGISAKRCVGLLLAKFRRPSGAFADYSLDGAPTKIGFPYKTALRAIAVLVDEDE